MFRPEHGLTPNRCLTVDTLHALYLGVMLVFCRHCVWALIQSTAWAACATQEEQLIMAVLRLRIDLNKWYKDRAQSNPHETLTRCTDISFKMVGDHAHKKLKTKGAETWGILLFVIHSLERHAACIPNAPILIEAGKCWVALVTVFDAAGVRMSGAETRECWDAYLRFSGPDAGF